jgi:hypothetical protein
MRSTIIKEETTKNYATAQQFFFFCFSSGVMQPEVGFGSLAAANEFYAVNGSLRGALATRVRETPWDQWESKDGVAPGLRRLSYLQYRVYATLANVCMKVVGYK